MSAALRWLAPAVCGTCLLLCAAAASAQAGTGGSSGSTAGIDVTVFSVDGEDVTTLDVIRLGLEECRENALVVFVLDNVPDKQLIDVWVGSDCNLNDRKNTDTNRCRFITTTSTEDQTQDLRVEVLALDLFQSCDDRTTGKSILWFLAVDTEESAEDVGSGYGTFELETDSERPLAPTRVTGGSGENRIPIEWDTDESDIERFIVYIDNEPTSGSGGSAGTSANVDGGGQTTGDCGSSVLTAGADPETLPSTLRQKRVNEPTASGVELSADEIGGETAAVAVVAVDEAGNQSPLSNVGCVKVVPTEGFWDRYETNGGTGQAGCPCSALGMAQLHSAWPIALSLLLVRLRRSAGARRRA